MPKKPLAIGGALIALYLGVRYATGTGNIISKGASGTATIVKTFQGR